MGSFDRMNPFDRMVFVRSKGPLLGLLRSMHSFGRMRFIYTAFDRMKCAKQLVEKLKPDILNGTFVNMEEKISQLKLDVIGLSLLNYNFDSLTTDSSVIDYVDTALKEVDLRSTDLLPHWKAEKAVALIRQTVEELIAKCKEIVESESERINEEAYVNHADPSILRFELAMCVVSFDDPLNYLRIYEICILSLNGAFMNSVS
ncbi:cytochrome P450 [Castilleja foliolosa]|uniref:Cytochrome P450 n=1 Tax=Castilleja foliolosa TaxID=1961234 RepID=A0ABD3C5J1_9LAMI